MPENKFQMFTASDGYTRIESDGDWCYLHHIVILLNDKVSPRDVFTDEGKEVHHRIGLPTECRAKLDIAGNLKLVGQEEHRRKHALDEIDHPDVEDILRDGSSEL
jgi:hypothetical protein